ncbi:hypothetical protein [Stygiolobus caldivivus]|uniref:Uncharacterized protein n=1 Tax=Stygiolobus caldivivus TaxID=2824673 RepID=A0A8D5ZHM5_9CREN|nr:hypothetical protein [Stygiolobus caldivivus]BCU69839.1 hypothetical protein KN1_11360 [Stygiolobus caldivivus]
MSKSRVRNHALYFLGVASYVVSLIPFVKVDALRALVLVPIIAYTLPVMEYVQPRVMSLKLGYKDVVLIIPALLPYVFMKPNIYILIPASLLVLTFLLYFTKLTMWGNVVGTAFEASLSMVWGTFVNNPLFLIPSLYWLLYIFNGAIYVEYKIPFRKLDKRVVQVSWLTSLLLMLFIGMRTPLLFLTLIEPTIRYLKPGEKLKSPKEIKELGRKGSRKDMAFLAILAISYFVSVSLLR